MDIFIGITSSHSPPAACFVYQFQCCRLGDIYSDQGNLKEMLLCCPSYYNFTSLNRWHLAKQIDLMVLKNANEMQISQAGISCIYVREVRIGALLRNCPLPKLYLMKFKFS